LDQVVSGVDEDAGVAHSEGDLFPVSAWADLARKGFWEGEKDTYASQYGENPMDVGRAGPREDNLARGDQDGRDADDADHGFGVGFAGHGVERVRVDQAAAERLAGDGDQAADADPEKGEARRARGPAADFGENDGVGDEAELWNEVALGWRFEYMIDL
jgi:hypothetical protein